MSPALALGILLVLVGIVGLSFGLYALVRGGRGQRGGLGALSRRGAHVLPGVTVDGIGALRSAARGYQLWDFRS